MVKTERRDGDREVKKGGRMMVMRMVEQEEKEVYEEYERKKWEER